MSPIVVIDFIDVRGSAFQNEANLKNGTNKYSTFSTTISIIWINDYGYYGNQLNIVYT
jgi:hypothetical protein